MADGRAGRSRSVVHSLLLTVPFALPWEAAGLTSSSLRAVRVSGNFKTAR